MATKNFVPRGDGEGEIGRTDKHWGKGWFDELEAAGLTLDAASAYACRSIYAKDWDISIAPAPAYAVSGLTDAGGLLYDPNSTETARFSIVLPPDADVSVNPILRLMLVPVVNQGAGGDQIQLQLTVRPVALGESINGAVAETISQTISGVPSAALELFAADFTLNGSLLAARDHIGLALSRLGADGNDTRLGDVAMLSAWLIYKKATMFETP
jgi:hypothetical protein